MPCCYMFGEMVSLVVCHAQASFHRYVLCSKTLGITQYVVVCIGVSSCSFFSALARSERLILLPHD